MNTLPIYDCKISANVADDFEVDFVALVDAPAIEKNFLMFNEQTIAQNFAIQNEEQRIVTGCLMVADKPIYRNDKMGEYYIKFSAETIKQIAIKYAKKGFQNNVNEMHDPKKIIDGCTMFESWIKDDSRGVAALKGFEDVENGSWFGSFHIDNNDVWAEIKEGKFRGFSVEGNFKIKPMESELLTVEQAMEKIKLILS